MKKSALLSLILAAVMLVGLFAFAGCSTQQGNKIVIELMTFHGPDSATKYYSGYKQIAEKYMKQHKNVEVKIKYEELEAYGSILETGFAGGTAPDIIQMLSGQRLTYSNNLLDLRPYLNESNPYDTRNEKWIDNFVGGEAAFPVENNNEVSNAFLFVPNDANPDVFAGSMYIFNTSLIKKAGLDPNNTPKTWKEMFEWLEALKQVEDISPIAGSNDVGTKVSQMGYQFGENYADKFFDEEINNPDFSSDLFWDKLYVLTCYEGAGDGSMPLDSLPYYPAMFKLMKQHLSYYQPSWLESSAETEILTFTSGKAAMMVTSYWDYDKLISSLPKSKFPDGYGIFPIPYLGTETLDYAVSKGWITQEEADEARPYAVDSYIQGGGTGVHEYGFSVNKAVVQDKEKLAVVIDFLKFLSSEDVQEEYVETAKSLSPVKDVKLIDMMKNFIIEEPEGGFAKNILGYTVVEWGKAGWDVEVVKFLKGDITWEEMVVNSSAPEWVKDIPSLDDLEKNVKAAEAELKSASDEEKETKERALEYAKLRLKLYDKYYYNHEGYLEELN